MCITTLERYGLYGYDERGVYNVRPVYVARTEERIYCTKRETHLFMRYPERKVYTARKGRHIFLFPTYKGTCIRHEKEDTFFSIARRETRETMAERVNEPTPQNVSGTAVAEYLNDAAKPVW